MTILDSSSYIPLDIPQTELGTPRLRKRDIVLKSCIYCKDKRVINLYGQKPMSCPYCSHK